MQAEQGAPEHRLRSALEEGARWLARQQEKGRLAGPNTGACKKISPQNSRKHGVTSRDVERRLDEGIDVPDRLFALARHLRNMADGTDLMDAHLIRKALIAARRGTMAQDALDMEMATSLYPTVDLKKARAGWTSDAFHGVAARGSAISTKKAEKLSCYAARFRSERDNAIKLLRQRPLSRSPP